MIRSVLPLSLAAALGVTACSSDPSKTAGREPQPKASVAHAQPTPYRPGTGVVQSVTPAPRMASAGATTTRGEPVRSAGAAPGSASTSPSAASSGAGAESMQRLAIRMDDGHVQYVDMASGPDVPPVGARVQLTPDYQIIRQQ